MSVEEAASGALGTRILVDTGGFTLYHLTSEKKGAIACTGACRSVWPPLLAGASKPLAGTGLSATRLATIKRPAGGVQVTYDGYALYRYSGDKQPGEVNGQGNEGLWYALTPSGGVTMQKPTATAPAPADVTLPARTSTSSSVAGSGASIGSDADTAGCPAGEAVPQGNDQGEFGNDMDDDNAGGSDDGDGCM